MYSVHMIRYTATDARKNFFHLLDAAERGEVVVLERHGVRFKIVVEATKPTEIEETIVLTADPDVLEGNWTWVSDEEGQLQFQVRDNS